MRERTILAVADLLRGDLGRLLRAFRGEAVCGSQRNRIQGGAGPPLPTGRSAGDLPLRRGRTALPDISSATLRQALIGLRDEGIFTAERGAQAKWRRVK